MYSNVFESMQKLQFFSQIFLMMFSCLFHRFLTVLQIIRPSFFTKKNKGTFKSHSLTCFNLSLSLSLSHCFSLSLTVSLSHSHTHKHTNTHTHLHCEDHCPQISRYLKPVLFIIYLIQQVWVIKTAAYFQTVRNMFEIQCVAIEMKLLCVCAVCVG